MTNKPTPTDAATPECLTCSDHGAVGNILTAEPCPDCTRLNDQPAPATQQAGEMEVFGLQWPGEDRINLSTVFDTETEALEYMKNRCDTPGIRPVRFSSNAPTAQAAESVPAREHDLQDVRCECCGYMTYHREHMGCIRAARKQ